MYLLPIWQRSEKISLLSCTLQLLLLSIQNPIKKLSSRVLQTMNLANIYGIFSRCNGDHWGGEWKRSEGSIFPKGCYYTHIRQVCCLTTMLALGKMPFPNKSSPSARRLFQSLRSGEDIWRVEKPTWSKTVKSCWVSAGLPLFPGYSQSMSKPSNPYLRRKEIADWIKVWRFWAEETMSENL